MSQARRLRLRGAPIIHDTIDNETIAINQLSGAYYSLEGPAALAWQLLGEGATEDQLVAEIERRYAAEPGAVERAVGELIEQLLAAELVVEERPAGDAAEAAEHASPPATTELPPIPADRPPLPDVRLQAYDDLATLLLADPIHEVDDTGWPTPMARPG